jgi:hypothetical protein
MGISWSCRARDHAHNLDASSSLTLRRALRYALRQYVVLSDHSRILGELLAADLLNHGRPASEDSVSFTRQCQNTGANER